MSAYQIHIKYQILLWVGSDWFDEEEIKDEGCEIALTYEDMYDPYLNCKEAW